MTTRLDWIVLLAGSLLGTAAQAGSVENMAGNWSSLTLSGSLRAISPKFHQFRWILINQTRLRDDNPSAWRLNEDQFYAQMGYSVNSYTSVWLGYVHDWHHSLGKTAYHESRPYQDLLFDFPVARFKAKIRTRLEERVNQATGNVGIRLRQMATLQLPLVFIDPKLSLYAGDEVLCHLNANSFGATGFSENRAMAGFSFQFNRRLGMDLGYLGQTIQETGGDIVLTHNVNANLSYRF
ncbi:DUF2490 domain-containing protein [Candidatus Methylobacter oryzae]|uniref:DUF2490 domain-containing protein n=1 Tax=Candidatus Methylobacter oryzae TaxID=2497749 RepID=A0ABY3CCV9_9GAMM|nr:DUF2490 domain-containing protein [Candidatus Methylobacter oryzae]